MQFMVSLNDIAKIKIKTYKAILNSIFFNECRVIYCLLFSTFMIDLTKKFNAV